MPKPRDPSQPKIPAQRPRAADAPRSRTRFPKGTNFYEHGYSAHNLNSYPIPERTDSLAYVPKDISTSSPIVNPNLTYKIVQPDSPSVSHAPRTTPVTPKSRAVRTKQSSPSDAALFWSFVGGLIRKQRAKSKAKKAAAAAKSQSQPQTSAFSPFSSSKKGIPTAFSAPQDYSLLREYEKRQHAQRAMRTKALISGPVRNAEPTLLRTDSGKQYPFPNPKPQYQPAPTNARTDTARGADARPAEAGRTTNRGIVMPSHLRVRTVEKYGVHVEPTRTVRGSERLQKQGGRNTLWGDFLRDDSEEENRMEMEEVSRRHAETDRDRERRETVDSDATFACVGVPSTSRFAPPSPSPYELAYLENDRRAEKGKGKGKGRADTPSPTSHRSPAKCQICHLPLSTGESTICQSCRDEYACPTPKPTPAPKPHSQPISPEQAAFAEFSSLNPYSPTSLNDTQRQERLLEAEYASFGDGDVSPLDGAAAAAAAYAYEDDREKLLTTRRGAFSLEAPPVPEEDLYMKRKLGGKGRRGEEGRRMRRSSFYGFWDEVLGSRGSLVGSSSRR